VADFCRQCVNECGMPGAPEGDFVNTGEVNSNGHTRQESWDLGFAPVVICECCGPIQVDPQGYCVSEDCFHRHKYQPKG